MTVQLKRRNSRYRDLTAGQPYLVIGIEANEFRILNDFGRPYLYPLRIFEVVDDHRPSDWIKETGDDGEEYAYPPSLNGVGFFEDFFEGQSQAVSAFWRVVNEHLAAAS